MEDLKKNWPLIVTAAFAVIVTGIAAVVLSSSEVLAQDMWGIPLWLTPLGYLVITWIISKEKFEKPVTAALAAAAYTLSAFLLFAAPSLSSQWHLPIGLWAFITIVFDL